MIGTYRAGTSVLHRARPGAKLLTLALLSTLLVVLATPWAIGVGALVVGAGFAVAGFGPRTLTAQLWPLRWFVLLLVPFQAWVAGWRGVVVVVGTLLVTVAGASLVTLTTPLNSLLDTMVRALSPLRRFGVDPERVGLLFALTLRTVPVIAQITAQSREARMARGLERSPRALLVPVLIRTLRHADRLGEALAARGVDD